MGEEKPKHAGGAPSKYRPEYCQALIEHMARGYSVESFAGTVDVDVDTIYQWAKVHPEFSEAKRKGAARSRIFWETLGMGLAGAQMKGGKQVKGSAASWIFNMKNRFGWRDRIEHMGGMKVTTPSSKLKDLAQDEKTHAAAMTIAEALSPVLAKPANEDDDASAGEDPGDAQE